MMRRIPWTTPERPSVDELSTDQCLAISAGDPWGHFVSIARSRSSTDVPCSHLDRAAGRFVDGPLEGTTVDHFGEHPLPVLLDGDGTIACDDPISIAAALAPELFEADGVTDRIDTIRTELIDAVYDLGHESNQATYEAAHDALAARVQRFDDLLSERRFLGGDDIDASDVLLFTFSVRLDSVYYELFKATIGLLTDFPALEAHARDLFERHEFWATTDFDAIKASHYRFEPVVNAKGIVPRGGIPDLDAPHFRADQFSGRDNDDATEEDQQKERAQGEWVRPTSEERNWVRADGEGDYPLEAGRYHVYAPYNCPWSHRVLLGRAVLGLEDVVGASIVYFRRDPDRGWQFNPRIPGCTADLANDKDYVVELYEQVGSEERSVPILWDTKSQTIVNNESAEILRMFSTEFGELATRPLELYPAAHRREIDRLNAEVYQRINNGAYKAGFAGSQVAYERAYARYFRALEWIEELLDERAWLAGTDHPTEADLRLFPTLFRHDEVYYARFKLNERRLSSYQRLSDWLDRMMDVPGVEEASNLDHARNGYFGRTGNEIVPAGPTPLGLSPKDFSRDVWLNG